MRRERLLELQETYRREHFESVIPFWLTHSLDQVNGGQFNSLDRDGTVFDTDKSMWLQGRALWMFAKLYNEVEPRPEWLAAARHIYDFIMHCGFDSDGRMFFAVTADGRPLRKRRYLFTETFAWLNTPARLATRAPCNAQSTPTGWWSIICAIRASSSPRSSRIRAAPKPTMSR